MKSTRKLFDRKVRVRVLITGLALLLLVSSGLALAQEQSQGSQGQSGQVSGQGQSGLIPNQAELRAKAQTIRDNHATCMSLRGDIAETGQMIRERVQELKQAGGGVDEPTRNTIRAAIETMKTAGATLRETAGGVAGEVAAMRGKRSARDWEAVEGHLDAIIAIQETRMAGLRTVLAEALKVLELLG